MKYITFAATSLVAALISACATQATNRTPAAVQTPAEIAAKVCPPVQAALSGLNALAGLPVDAKANLDAVTPIVAGVCAASATINLSNLQTLQQTALPTIINTVKASGMAVERQNSVILDITTAQIILSAVVEESAQTNAQTNTPTQADTAATK